jgi:hypothetical protein
MLTGIQQDRGERRTPPPRRSAALGQRYLCLSVPIPGAEMVVRGFTSVRRCAHDVAAALVDIYYGASLVAVDVPLEVAALGDRARYHFVRLERPADTRCS